MNVYLKWEMEMMTSRLRATVRRELKKLNNRMQIMVSKWGRIGFLQDLFRSCGKQSSVSSKVSIIRNRRTCWALAPFRPKLSVIQFITILPAQPSLSLTSAALFLSTETEVLYSLCSSSSMFVTLVYVYLHLWLSARCHKSKLAQIKW